MSLGVNNQARSGGYGFGLRGTYFFFIQRSYREQVHLSYRCLAIIYLAETSQRRLTGANDGIKGLIAKLQAAGIRVPPKATEFFYDDEELVFLANDDSIDASRTNDSSLPWHPEWVRINAAQHRRLRAAGIIGFIADDWFLPVPHS